VRLGELIRNGTVDGTRAVLLDVREAQERAIVALPGGDWLPVAQVRTGARPPGLAPGARVYVYCKTGARSGEAVDLLRAGGVDAVNVDGGLLAWVAEVEPHLPTY
jgi:adenylyltransferase/sulfurtransferase